MESKCIENSWRKEWRNSNRNLHRENDLPAIEYPSGSKIWCKNGEIHREIGPASIWFDGEEEWYLNDIEYKPETMPPFLYVNYLRWEYRKKNGI